MKVAFVHVSGFRLLDDAIISLEGDTTIIVGRNNSGKTSLVEAFYKFLGTDKVSFTLDDFNLKSLAEFRSAAELWRQAEQARVDGNSVDAEQLESDAITLLPNIRLDVEFVYDEAESLAPISDLILDLDPDRHDVLLSCRYVATRPLEFLKAYSESGFEDIVDFLRKRMHAFFDREFLAIDKADPTNLRTVNSAQAKAAVLCDFIYAQNLFDDTSSDTGHGLSKGFESYYRAIANPDGTIESLEAALVDVASKLDSEYTTLFADVFGDLKHFGAGRMPSLQEIRIVSEFSAANLLNGSTRVMYAHESGTDLPEAHNGLGFSKLIFIILQFVSFFEAYKKRQPRSGVQLLFLEEPEAHLHPQMQTVFIKNVSDYLKLKPEWNVQLVITTHSSHVVAESGFSCLRYFDTTSNSLKIKDLSTFRTDLEVSDETTLKFLQQYMALQRCDLFFADKAIFVEGTVERLVLPKLIKKSAPALQHEYISVIEVGGAYAVKFKKLIEFLGIPTLVITDIDSADPKGRHPKTRTDTTGAITTNVTLKEWLPQSTMVADLLAKADADKISGAVRVAYQVPEVAGSGTGRSFEEAFILANADQLANATSLASKRIFTGDDGKSLSADAIRADAYEIAGRIDSKSDFAFDILTLEDWITPRYIEEGLKWLVPPIE
ncbi:ATP-dependent nuclease [Acidithrix ferrooxidans]|uniref:DNA replication and repair protein RecF n=1 Tax=Acidithrix ferrooxidans TaxID=1280514 RepID=A0A0D8HF74_9ACTN|nr:AAA family ATPase [Acidithrix ferrooxidans]KJF16615.1 DNA replication and repair protein RecF [Acidithrix ferrooxidans]